MPRSEEIRKLLKITPIVQPIKISRKKWRENERIPVTKSCTKLHFKREMAERKDT